MGNAGKMTRRAFLHGAQVGVGAMIAGRVLAGCSTPPPRELETAVPTRTAAQTPVVMKTPVPTQPAGETAIPTPGQRSLLVRARGDQVWKGEALDGDLLRQMLDASLAALTGQPDARQAWSALFKPGERVAIKVNAMTFGTTSPALVMAVAGRLQEMGIPAENITIYDRTSEELKNAGFELNPSGKGLRCLGSDGHFSENSWTLVDKPIVINRSLEECDALISMPVLKGFSIGGISFALKNHYGSFNIPSLFHDERFSAGVTGLNALPVIREKTRLVIGDVLARESHQDSTSYAVIGGANSILVSAHPVTVDRMGLNMAVEELERKGLNTRAIQAQAAEWLHAGAVLGLGAEDLESIDLKELRL